MASSTDIPRMGYERQCFVGTAGTTAASQLLNLQSVEYQIDNDTADTTVMDDGLGVPIETSAVVLLKGSLKLKLVFSATDTVGATVIAAAVAGGTIAIRAKHYSTGKGPDADFVVKTNFTGDMKAGQIIEIEAKPSRGAGRKPQLYV